jgi:hypothetical protein
MEWQNKSGGLYKMRLRQGASKRKANIFHKRHGVPQGTTM